MRGIISQVTEKGAFLILLNKFKGFPGENIRAIAFV
jgi:hypothetical protein